MAIEVLQWLDSPDAARVGRAEIRHLRLPLSHDDLLQEARVRLLRTRFASPIENPAGYGRVAMQNAARDLHRRRRARVVEEVWPEEDLMPDAHWDGAEIDPPGQLEDQCRRAAHGSLARTPWTGAAVLNELTFRLHPDVPIPGGAPHPDGAGEDQEGRWAALWLAGKFDCFPDGDHPEDPAMRKRRSRALHEVMAALDRAVRVATPGAGR